MKQPEELSAYKESVLQDIAQAQRVGADENAITALISQYPLDQALAARLARCYGPKGLESFNLDGIDVAALPAQQKHAKEPDQSVLQQVWEEHVALVMDQVCRMSPEYLDLEQETRWTCCGWRRPVPRTTSRPCWGWRSCMWPKT